MWPRSDQSAAQSSSSRRLYLLAIARGVAAGCENFYYALGLASRDFDVSFNLVPPGQRFLGIFPSKRNAPSDRAQVQVPGKEGLLVLRAPMNGTSYAGEVDAALKRTDCRPLDQP